MIGVMAKKLLIHASLLLLLALYVFDRSFAETARPNGTVSISSPYK
jgi:hypothetical protein